MCIVTFHAEQTEMCISVLWVLCEQVSQLYKKIYGLSGIAEYNG